METFLIRAVQLIISLSILVVIHELGHFLFARLFKVRVEKFYLFFNPWFTLFKYKPKNSDTEYGVGWLPLGGYCKISGMIDESMDKEQMKQPAQPWEFRSKPTYQRLLIMIGGVLFNFILALLIYIMIAFTWGKSYIPFKNITEGLAYSEVAKEIGFKDGDIPLMADGEELVTLNSDGVRAICEAKEVTVLRGGKKHYNIAIPNEFMLKIVESRQPFATINTPPAVDSVIEGGGAENAGIVSGDIIYSIDRSVTRDVSQLFTQLELKEANDTITAVVKRGDVYIAKKVGLSDDKKLGIMLKPLSSIYNIEVEKYSLMESIPQGVSDGFSTLGNYVGDFKYVFTKEGAKSLGGFGSIGSIFPPVWNWEAFWSMTAFLSIILAFMNILPIPALDGGHVLFLLYEIIARRKPSEKFMERAQMVGMIILITLLLVANGNDVLRLFN